MTVSERFHFISQSNAVPALGLALVVRKRKNKANQNWDQKMLRHESVPFTWQSVAALVPVHARWVIAALNSISRLGVGGGQRCWGIRRWSQKPVQTATAVLKCGSLLFLSKYFDAHRLKHPWVHEGLTKTDSFVARHCLITKETVERDVCQHHIHGLWAQEAVVIGFEVVAPALHLHMSLQVGNDAGPDIGGTERFSCHALFWWGNEKGGIIRGVEMIQSKISHEKQTETSSGNC